MWVVYLPQMQPAERVVLLSWLICSSYGGKTVRNLPGQLKVFTVVHGDLHCTGNCCLLDLTISAHWRTLCLHLQEKGKFKPITLPSNSDNTPAMSDSAIFLCSTLRKTSQPINITVTSTGSSIPGELHSFKTGFLERAEQDGHWSPPTFEDSRWCPFLDMLQSLASRWGPFLDMLQSLASRWCPFLDMLQSLVSCWWPFLDMLQLLVSRWCPFLDMMQLLVSSWCPFLDMMQLLVSGWCPFLDMLQLSASHWCPFLDMLQSLVSHWCPFLDMLQSLVSHWCHFLDMLQSLMSCWCPFLDMLQSLMSCWCPFLYMLQLLVLNILQRWCPFLDMLQLLVLYNLQRSPAVHPGYHPVYTVVHWQMQSVGWPLCASSSYSVHLDSQLCLWDWNYAVVKIQSQFQRSEWSHMICVTKM